jgi:UV DNA damage endonuclease
MTSSILSESQKQNLSIGYCCLNVDLRKSGVFTSRTCRLKTLQDAGIEHSYRLAKQNLEDLETIIHWNAKHKINLFRMSSEMFPFATHPDYYQLYNIEQFRSTLVKLGALANSYNQRLTFHPGQYNVLSSQNDAVVEKAIIDINFHAKILDMMNIDKNGVIVIHGGSKQGGKDAALNRFRCNFPRLSQSAQNRLVLENCEMAYSIEDLLPISNDLSIPIVIDYHHHNINPGTVELTKSTDAVLEVWKSKGVIPLFHLSESRCDVKVTDSITARRAHSDFVQEFPQVLLDLIKTTTIHLDIEAKMKDKAVLQLYQKYQLVH